MSFFFVTDAEKGGLEDMDVSGFYQFGEELEEKSEEEETDVHAIDIGVGGDDHAVVAEAVEAFLNIQGVLEEVELLVFIDDFSGEAEAIEGFAAERENGLCFHVPGGGECSGSGIAFRDEDRAFLAALVFGIQVDAAVAEFFVVDLGFAIGLLGGCADSFEIFAFLFGLDDFSLDDIGDVFVAMEE